MFCFFPLIDSSDSVKPVTASRLEKLRACGLLAALLVANIAKVAVYGCSSAPTANLPFGCLFSKVAAPSVQSIHSELPLIEKFARRERKRKGNVSPFDVRRFRIRGCLLGTGCPLFLFVERLKLQGNALSL